jgi:hypothetical protein
MVCTIPLLAAGALSGCSGADALANHSDLVVHTHMSETVFLDPVPQRLHTIYIGMRNTSDYPDIDVRGPLAAALQQRGYTVVSDPGQAYYLLQGNVLQAGKLDQSQKSSLLGGGFGQALLAGGAAGGLTSGLGGSNGAALGVGLGVAAATAAFNYAYQNVTYAVTVDLQLSERPLHGGKVRQTTNTYRNTSNGSSAVAVTDSTPQSYGVSGSSSYNSNSRSQSIDETSDFKKYNVRDVAYADQVNLKMEQAIPTLVQHLSSSFANLFE